MHERSPGKLTWLYIPLQLSKIHGTTKLSAHAWCVSITFARLYNNHCTSRCHPRAQWMKLPAMNQFSVQWSKRVQSFMEPRLAITTSTPAWSHDSSWKNKKLVKKGHPPFSPPQVPSTLKKTVMQSRAKSVSLKWREERAWLLQFSLSRGPCHDWVQTACTRMRRAPQPLAAFC